MAEAVPNGKIDTGNALATIPEAAARDLAAALPISQLVRAITTLSPTENARALAVIPPGLLAGVLMADELVFDPKPRFDEEPQGWVEPLKSTEAERLQAAGLESWLVPLEDNPVTGEVIRWGLRPWREQFRAAEAWERLEAILDSGNDEEWKQEALEAMPPEYWALALQAGEHQDAHDRFAAISSIDEKLGVVVAEWRRRGEAEILARLMDERADYLLKHRPEIAVSDEAAGVIERLEARHRARDILAEIRGGKRE